MRATDPMPALAKAMSRRPNRHRRLDEPLDVVLDGDVAPARSTDRVAELVGDRRERRRREVGDDDPPALGDEAAGGGQADAGGTAGDDRDLAGEATGCRALGHRCSSCTSGRGPAAGV